MNFRQKLKDLNNLSLDEERLKETGIPVSMYNLNLMSMMIKIFMFVIFGGFLSVLYFERNIEKAGVYILCEFCAYFFLKFTEYLRKLPLNLVVKKVKICVYLYSAVSYAGSIYIGTVQSDGRLAVTAIWMFMFVQIIFIQKISENFVTLIPGVILFVAGSIYFKDVGTAYYDIIHVVIACIIGGVVGWNASKSKIHSMLADMRIKEANQQLYNLSTRDFLTGVYNRRKIFEKLNKIVEECAERNLYLSCLIIDIDDFKFFNDQYGHPEGDKLIINIAEVIDKYSSDKEMMMGRIGGEEFLVVCEHNTMEEVYKIAETIRKKVENLHMVYTIGKEKKNVTISVGVVSLRLVNENFNEKTYEFTRNIYKFADDALYKAKKSGKNCCWEYDIRKKEFRKVEGI